MKTRQELSAREVEEMQESLARRLGDTSIPTLPQVAVKIIELISNPSSTVEQFADVIKTDQALTGRLLRLANSALFAQRTPVTRIERAMVLLGMERLKAISLGFHLSKAMSTDDGPFSLKRQWTQSLFRAWLALHLAESVNKQIAGEAFIVGMLNDSGLSVTVKLLGEQYTKFINPNDTPSQQFVGELKNLPFTHADASAVLTRMWKLPDLLARPIAQHHTPARALTPDDPSSVLHAIAYFVGSVPLDGDAAAPAEDPLPNLARKLFGKEPEEMQTLVRKSAEAFKASRDMFSHMLDPNLGIDHIVEKANSLLSDKVEELVVEAVKSDTPDTKTLRFQTNGMVLELEVTTGKRVMVYISDQTGNRLVSEEIDPKRQSEKQIRQLLMLDEVSAEDAEAVMGGITKLAA